MTWTYKQTEPGLWTVGFYTPEGQWEPETDHDDPQRAAARVAYLNGGGARSGEVECADCGFVLAHMGAGFDHLEQTKHAGIRFVGGSDRVWSPIS